MPKIANWVQETVSGTPGTGTITLGGAVPGYIKFADSGIATASKVLYEIEDGQNRESGIGTLTTGTPWTLSRDIILRTLVSGTYDDSSPTAISVTTNAKVGIVSSSESSGIVVGMGATYLGSQVACTTGMNLTDTVPTTSHGTQVITCSYTPKYDDSTIRIEGKLYGYLQASGNVQAALFNGVSSNAIAATGQSATNAHFREMTLAAEEISGSTSSRTYAIHAGSNIASNFYINGTNGGRYFGGVANSFLKVTEYR